MTTRPGPLRPDTPDEQDCRDPHTYLNQVQPPIGIRLRQALNYLADEDVDRRQHFAREVAELLDWLLHLQGGGGSSGGENGGDTDQEARQRRYASLGNRTKAMIDDALARIEAHALFEKAHYGSSPKVDVFDPSLIPRPVPPLQSLLGQDRSSQLAMTPPAKYKRDRDPVLAPRPLTQRPQTVVNRLWMESRPGIFFARDAKKVLGEHEGCWWERRELTSRRPDDTWSSLAFIESEAYETFVRNQAKSSEELSGDDRQYMHDTTHEILAGDKASDRHGPGNYATERGATRAALQYALRSMTDPHNRKIARNYRHTRLVLPATAQQRERARLIAGARPGLKFPLHSIEESRIPLAVREQPDPQAYTVLMAEFMRLHRTAADTAREKIILDRLNLAVPDADRMDVDGGARSDQRHATLPALDNSPYIWRGIDAETQYEQDLYRKMVQTKELFDRDMKIAPRQLLTTMNESYQLGFSGRQGRIALGKLRLNKTRDYMPDGKLRGLDKVELMWIRFLLDNSVNQAMVEPLQERTALFLNFGARLEKLMSDLSPDSLWPDVETSVDLETLMLRIHQSASSGAIQKTKFMPYDCMQFLDRLSQAGRCRFSKDFRVYGWISRPLLELHPEALIQWPDRDVPESHEHPEDLVGAPRFADVQTWKGLIEAKASDDRLLEKTSQYFKCLAYRWGFHMGKLERHGTIANWNRLSIAGEEPKLDHDAMNIAMSQWKHDMHLGDVAASPSLIDVVRYAEPSLDTRTMTPAEALDKIHVGIIDEMVGNEPMLLPGRSTIYTSAIDGSRKIGLTRGPLWDWARPEVRGKAKQFFSLNRWPVTFQDEKTQAWIKSDKSLDPQQTWHPMEEDPPLEKYFIPKGRPYVWEKVKYNHGRRFFPIGDTPLQKENFRLGLESSVIKALGHEE